MAVFILVFGVIFRVSYQYVKILAIGEGYKEINKSSTQEAWCRGTDIWLMGWGALLNLDVGAIDLQVLFALLMFGVVGLFVCIAMGAIRKQLYVEVPERRKFQGAQNRAWVLTTTTEYVIGLYMYLVHVFLNLYAP